MKNLLILLTMMVLLSVLSPSAYAPDEATSYGSLKSCLGRPGLVSISDSLIYCSQAGTIFQDINDLTNRGFQKFQLLSQK